MSIEEGSPLDPRELKTKLKARAFELGFHGFGIAPADPLDTHREFLAQWLALGYAGEMNYMSEHQALRSDPQLVLPGAKSVICLLVDYSVLSKQATETKSPESVGVSGKVARYAQVRDYHIVLKKRLRKLSESLQAWLPAARTRPCVDSVPLLERAYAWRAGLGFFGKNSLLLTPGRGSYTLLAELLIDQELPYDAPVEGTCGRCTRCIDACPTDALVSPGVVDATQCISYWTIEKRGDLPPLADLNGWAFGCDICQEVCPYNHGEEPPPALGSDFETPRAAGPHLREAEIQALENDAGFLERFAGTPVMRAGRTQALRNLKRISQSVASHAKNHGIEPKK